LMAYSKTKLKRNGDRASPCSSQFIRQNFTYTNSAIRFI
jgi:hypothetical protein